MCKEKQNEAERNVKSNFTDKERDVKKCIYWTRKKRNEEGKYYCTWDGEFYWMEECKGCRNYREKQEKVP